MEITKNQLKKIIKEEMEILSQSGDIYSLTEVEKRFFKSMLERLSPQNLVEFGIKKLK
tara:strand:+ start:277 stop:450 length:174 start_codon:yes stop_codon:yes gene_type:complete